MGNGVGYLGNAATGIVFAITVIGWGASVLFGDGMATYLSLSQGKGDTSTAGRSVANSILGSFLSGVVIIAVCYPLGDSVFYALGATDATILGQFISFVIYIAYLRKSRVFRVKASDFILSWRHLKPVLPLGAGSFLTQLCIVATTIANNILLKSYGAQSEYGPDIPLSAFVVIIKLFQIILNIDCLRIYLSLVIFTCLQKACAMFLQSIGHAKSAVPLSVLRDILLIVLAILMPMQMGIMGILWSAPVADVIAMVITAVVVARVWKTMGADTQPIGRQTETVLRPSCPGVIVTIAQEHGSAGKRIGQLVADYVLRKRDNVVRVFIHAPKDYRVKKVMEMYGDTEAEGKKSIARSDAARGAYYKSISGHEWGGPHQYELSVDSSIGPEKTAQLIYSYLAQK